MSILQRIKRWWMGSQQNKKYSYALDNPVQLKQTDLADQGNTSPKNFLSVGSLHQEDQDDLYQHWLSLSPREQDVTALTCLGYTNRQIAFKLGISDTTVKSYLQNVLHKFNLHSKIDLRLAFVNWDFSAWGRPHP